MKEFLLSIGMLTIIVLQFEMKAFSSHLSIAHFGHQPVASYEIYKIDSLNNCYLIYAKNKNQYFKIISQKKKKTVQNIFIGKAYKLKLHSFLTVNGQSIVPADQINEISGWAVNDSTTINFEGDSIRDLFYADNLKGLHLTRDNK